MELTLISYIMNFNTRIYRQLRVSAWNRKQFQGRHGVKVKKWQLNECVWIISQWKDYYVQHCDFVLTKYLTPQFPSTVRISVILQWICVPHEGLISIQVCLDFNHCVFTESITKLFYPNKPPLWRHNSVCTSISLESFFFQWKQGL